MLKSWDKFSRQNKSKKASFSLKQKDKEEEERWVTCGHRRWTADTMVIWKVDRSQWQLTRKLSIVWEIFSSKAFVNVQVASQDTESVFSLWWF